VFARLLILQLLLAFTVANARNDTQRCLQEHLTALRGVAATET